MICPKCKTNNEQENRFCKNCGSDLKQGKATQDVDNNSVNADKESGIKPSLYIVENHKKIPIFTKKNIGWIIAFFAVIIVISIIIGVVVRSESPLKGLNTKSDISIKGVFYLEPDDSIDMSNEGLLDGQRYLFIVYDVIPPADSNEELAWTNDSPILTLNETNTYEQITGSYDSYLNSFLCNSGYKVPTENITLLGGGTSVRMITAFAVNANDINESTKALFSFNFSERLTQDIEISATDIEEIDIFDGVFKVEDNPEFYQVAKSIATRSELADRICQATLRKYQSDANQAFLGISMFLPGLFSRETTYGISVVLPSEIEIISADSLPPLNLEAVNEVYPDIADNVRTIVEETEGMIDLFSTGDMDATARSIDLVMVNIEEVNNYFEDL